MTNKTPRAERRRQQRAFKKAQGVVSGAKAEDIIGQASVPGRPSKDGGAPIDLAAVYQRIGALTVEKDYWANRALVAEKGVGGDTDVPPEVQAMLDAVEEGQIAQNEATALAEQAVDEAQVQADEDAEKFPELQDTDGKILADEGEELLVTEETDA